MESTITITEAEKDFSNVIHRVVDQGDTAILTRNGQAVARIVPEKKKTSTGFEMAEYFSKRTRMPREEADAFAKDIEEIRRIGNAPQRDPWAE